MLQLNDQSIVRIGSNPNTNPPERDDFAYEFNTTFGQALREVIEASGIAAEAEAAGYDVTVNYLPSLRSIQIQVFVSKTGSPIPVEEDPENPPQETTADDEEARAIKARIEGLMRANIGKIYPRVMAEVHAKLRQRSIDG